MHKLAALGFCFSCLLLAEDAALQQVKVSKTDHMDFPSGGLLSLHGEFTSVTIEGWDQPGFEITTTKTTHQEFLPANRQQADTDLDLIHFSTDRHGNELALTATMPHKAHAYLDARIYVPRNARLAVDASGQLYIDDISGAIESHLEHGTMVLHLPEQGHYDIDARCKWGTVNSDFPGEVRRTRWFIGHSFVDQPSANAQKLHLRAGYGDIVIVKIETPKEPTSPRPTS
jgi:hypothetical protein